MFTACALLLARKGNDFAVTAMLHVQQEILLTCTSFCVCKVLGQTGVCSTARTENVRARISDNGDDRDFQKMHNSRAVASFDNFRDHHHLVAM